VVCCQALQCVQYILNQYGLFAFQIIFIIDNGSDGTSFQGIRCKSVTVKFFTPEGKKQTFSPDLPAVSGYYRVLFKQSVYLFGVDLMVIVRILQDFLHGSWHNGIPGHSEPWFVRDIFWCPEQASMPGLSRIPLYILLPHHL